MGWIATTGLMFTFCQKGFFMKAAKKSLLFWRGNVQLIWHLTTASHCLLGNRNYITFFLFLSWSEEDRNSQTVSFFHTVLAWRLWARQTVAPAWTWHLINFLWLLRWMCCKCASQPELQPLRLAILGVSKFSHQMYKQLYLLFCPYKDEEPFWHYPQCKKTKLCQHYSQLTPDQWESDCEGATISIMYVSVDIFRLKIKAVYYLWKEHREGITRISASSKPETTAIVSTRVLSRDLSKVGCSVALGQRLTAKSGCRKTLLQLDCGNAVIIYERL